MTPARRLKTAIAVGTRPEVIRLSRVIAELDRTTDLTLIHTGQNYDRNLNAIFFEELQIRQPDHFLDAAGPNGIITIAQTLAKIDPILEAVSPDAFLVLGDTNSSLSVLAAKRRRIPVFHMEAGNRCFDERVPEEINRRIVDHISDINLTYSEHARRYLVAEGISADRIIKTGSPMYEVLSFFSSDIERSDILKRCGVAARSYIVLSSHREENVDDLRYLKALHTTVNDLAQRYDMPIIFSAHPRTRRRLDEANLDFDRRIHLHEPFGFFDYLKLQQNAFVVLSDSGTITEEASILGFAAVNIRESHERPEGMDEARVPFAGLDTLRISQCIEIVTGYDSDGPRRFALPADYAVPNVSAKIARIVLSYTNFVRRTVWQERGPTFE